MDIHTGKELVENMKDGIFYWLLDDNGFSDIQGISYNGNSITRVFANLQNSDSFSNEKAKELREFVMSRLIVGGFSNESLNFALVGMDWYSETIELIDEDYNFIKRRIVHFDDDLEDILGVPSSQVVDAIYRKNTFGVDVEELHTYFIELQPILVDIDFGETKFQSSTLIGDPDAMLADC